MIQIDKSLSFQISSVYIQDVANPFTHWRCLPSAPGKEDTSLETLKLIT